MQPVSSILFLRLIRCHCERFLSESIVNFSYTMIIFILYLASDLEENFMSANHIVLSENLSISRKRAIKPRLMSSEHTQIKNLLA